ncbi:MAG: RHS repeat-associated core domain-containing protein, partial [Parabacteroides sp.]|nr:RHS repeat-associated core domain-containing protein [Parabacteroides sp.]
MYFTDYTANNLNQCVSISEDEEGSSLPEGVRDLTYDLDGNLLNDERIVYEWDAENRLTSMTVNTNVGPQFQLDFQYDWMGRRISKTVKTNGVTSYSRKFLYDGWNLIAELDGNNALVRAYTWGLDLSGTTQGAGGVGGLLMVNAGTNGVHFPAYDLNGNVMGLVNAANGIISAKYEYGPFGEVFCAVGDMARVNPFQFSTKYTDFETDLVYYGYRYYSPALGRWLSRDPIEEQGGLNLYGFVGNDPVNRWDVLGYSWFSR